MFSGLGGVFEGLLSPLFALFEGILGIFTGLLGGIGG